MSFLQDDDFLLLMSHNTERCPESALPIDYHVLTTAEKVKLYDAGIRTSHEQPAWQAIEPAQGQYNFDYLDDIIQSNRDAGMKSLLQICGWRVPKWMPNDWFAKAPDGRVERESLSLWNEEAQKYSDTFYKFMRDRYASQKDVAFFYGEYQGGEGIYPPTMCFFDRAALDDYKTKFGSHAVPDINTTETKNWFGDKIVEHVIQKCEILYPSYQEMWNAQQFLMNTWSLNFGNFVQPEILRMFRRFHSEAHIILLQYTYFDSSHDERNVDYVNRLVEVSQCEVIAEAMFCDGLKHTTPLSIKKGFRGQIVHPAKSGFSGTGELEDWMVDEIKKSCDLWRASKG
jgi:hypothetical protein